MQKRRIDEERKRDLVEKEIEKELKKQKEKKERIEKAKRKKQELLDRLARRGEIVIMREGKDIEWIRRKQSQWRKY